MQAWEGGQQQDNWFVFVEILDISTLQTKGNTTNLDQILPLQQLVNEYMKYKIDFRWRQI